MGDKDKDVDHYLVLGLPSGEEGAKLSEKEISKAYRAKALELHPDKRPDDPYAHENFQRLKMSYEVLKDEKLRKLFDDLLSVKRNQQRRLAQQDPKRRKMVSDLEERERAAFAPDAVTVARQEEEMIARKLKEEIARVLERKANKGAASPATKTARRSGKESRADSGLGLDKEKVLKVTWEKIGADYTLERLKEVFSEFGKVEDVVIRSSRKRSSALVVMGSKDAAVAATGTVCGDLSNPLLVIPLQPSVPTGFPVYQKPEENVHLDNLVGASYQDFEDSVLKKFQRKAEQNK